MKGREPAKVEFRCPACGQDAWLARKPQYDGFKKIGETLSCALCGHAFASEAEIPFKDNRPKVFSENDRPRPVQVFREDEKEQMCRYCAEYVVNPFLQRCSLHKCEVQATDTCPHFRPKPAPPPAAAEPDAPNPLRL